MLSSGRVRLIRRDQLAPYPAHEVPKAWFDGRQVWVVADLIAPDELKGVLLHDIGVHAASRWPGGYPLESLRRALSKKVLDGDILATTVYRRALRHVGIAQSPEAFVLLSDAHDPIAHRVHEEAMGYYVEAGAERLDQPWYKRLLAIGRRLLVETFGFTVGTGSLTPADFAAFARSAGQAWGRHLTQPPAVARSASTRLAGLGLDATERLCDVACAVRQPLPPQPTVSARDEAVDAFSR